MLDPCSGASLAGPSCGDCRRNDLGHEVRDPHGARDDDFEPLEGFFYFGRLIGALGLAAAIAARKRGWLRAVTFVAAFAVAFLVSVLLGDAVQNPDRE